MNTSPKSSKAADKAEAETQVEAVAAEAPPAAADAVAAEVAALRAEVRALVEQVGAVGVAARGGAKRAARAIAAEGADVGARAADDILAEWHAFDARVVSETRANPWRSLGIAALVGALTARLLR
jgi:ElaB/YqjD/DUF883 family membrane-anchored ribosome-binding protein